MLKIDPRKTTLDEAYNTRVCHIAKSVGGILSRGVSSLGSARNLAREPRVLKSSARSSQAY